MRTSGAQTQEDVLRALRRQDGPLTAYELLDRLREGRGKVAPPTVYRALSALIEQGRAHRVESINAFVACRHDHHDQAAVLAICGDCGDVKEHVDSDILSRLTTLTQNDGFQADRHVVELHGRCADCVQTTSVL